MPERYFYAIGFIILDTSKVLKHNKNSVTIDEFIFNNMTNY